MSTYSTRSAKTSRSPRDGRASVSVYVAGVGAVGTALLRQLDSASGCSTDLHVVGACTSRRAAWDAAGLAPDRVSLRLTEGKRLDWPAVLNRLTQDAPRPLVFVDVTGSPQVAGVYERLLDAGVHVVTANKIANTQSQSTFDRLQAVAADRGVQYRFETTVGAGLPVVQTVRDFAATGDHVRSIRGAVSGSLTFLFSALRNGTPFSTAVRTAVERGYTEPDVRIDLSGEDVARKFLILARTAVYTLERDDVHVESLVPEALDDLSRDAFLDQLDTLDDYWRSRSRSAEEEGSMLQYAGCLSDGTVDVGVRQISENDALGRLEGQNNLFEITTDRYAESPVVVRGPGAGPDVTAAGVLADVRKIACALTG